MDSMRPVFIGQRVRVMYPGGVYGSGAAYVTFDDKGTVTSARQATDEEVQWWEQLLVTRELTNQIRSLQLSLISAGGRQ